jgi:NAD(P)-dependent dehydrogenase (short-subunit alcohol dehydrogenase family)
MRVSGGAALVTGGKRIGAAVARALAAAGMDVGLSYNKSRAEAEETAAGITASGRRAHIASANLGNPDDCRALVDGTAAALGRLDVLVNMASVYTLVPFDQTDEHTWHNVMDVDLRAAFLCARAAVPHMRRGGGGRIINFSDWLAASGRPRYPGYLPYYVAKAGAIAMTEALALEVAADQILVNAIAPGPIVAPPGTTPQELKDVEAATPLGRWGGADAIVRAVMFLVETDYVTGETIRVDGGRHLK